MHIQAKKSFRERLYSETKPQHLSVENTFDLGGDLNHDKLQKFLKAIYISRFHYQKTLDLLERKSKIETNNQELIGELKLDLQNDDINLAAITKKLGTPVYTDSSSQIGIFYVFAGSSMGARHILGNAKKQSITTSLNYLNGLVDHSAHQMRSLNQIIKTGSFDEGKVISSAQATFDFINNTTKYEF